MGYHGNPCHNLMFNFIIGHAQIQGDIFNLLIFTVIWHFLNIFVIICTMDLLFWHMIDIGMLDIIVKK